jgi:hypothetical protein
MVGACSEGLRGGGVCALAAAKNEPSPAVAIVAWDDEGHLAVRVEVGLRRGDQSEWLARQVAFRESDAEVERWRAVGLIIATLVGEASSVAEARAAPPAIAEPPHEPAHPPEPSPEAPKIAPPFSPRPARWCFDLAFDLARGTSDGLGARGGALRVSRYLGAGALFATSSLRYEAQPSAAPQIDLAWGWATIGLGAALIIPGTRMLIDARVEPTLGWLRASVAHGAGAESGLLVGLREGLAATWWLTDAIGASLGAEAYETTQRAVVRLSVDGGPPAAQMTEQPLGWTTLFALRFRLD